MLQHTWVSVLLRRSWIQVSRTLGTLVLCYCIHIHTYEKIARKILLYSWLPCFSQVHDRHRKAKFHSMYSWNLCALLFLFYFQRVPELENRRAAFQREKSERFSLSGTVFQSAKMFVSFPCFHDLFPFIAVANSNNKVSAVTAYWRMRHLVFETVLNFGET